MADKITIFDVLNGKVDGIALNGSNRITTEILSDLEWHCWECMVKDGVSRDTRPLRTLAERGFYTLRKPEGSNNSYDIMDCPVCGKKTTHRAIVSTEIDEIVSLRMSISKDIKRKVKALYGGLCVVQNIPSRGLQIDHKVPVKRNGVDEDFNNFDDDQLKKYFMPISAHMNSRKKSHCDTCIDTGIRGCDPSGLNMFYSGTSEYKGTCEGCFWYDPEEWRKYVKSL